MRLFAAAEVPPPQLDSVSRAVDALRPLLPEARWTNRSGWHVTLKFFGEVADERVDGLLDALSAAAGRTGPVESRLSGLGAFPTPSRARVLWAGIEDAAGELGELGAAIGRLSGFPPEERRLRPHLTIARFRRPASVARALSAVDGRTLDLGSFTIDRVTLFRSHLGGFVATYEPVRVWELSAGSSL